MDHDGSVEYAITGGLVMYETFAIVVCLLVMKVNKNIPIFKFILFFFFLIYNNYVYFNKTLQITVNCMGVRKEESYHHVED